MDFIDMEICPIDWLYGGAWHNRSRPRDRQTDKKEQLEIGSMHFETVEYGNCREFDTLCFFSRNNLHWKSTEKSLDWTAAEFAFSFLVNAASIVVSVQRDRRYVACVRRSDGTYDLLIDWIIIVISDYHWPAAPIGHDERVHRSRCRSQSRLNVVACSFLNSEMNRARGIFSSHSDDFSLFSVTFRRIRRK